MSGLVAPKRAGSNAEAAVLVVVPELEPLPQEDATADARVSETFRPTADLPSVALPLVERDRLVEIKSAIYELDNGRAGRFYLRRKQHRELVDEGALYLFAVCSPAPERPPLALKIAPATCVSDAISSWISVDGRADYAQISWSRIIDESEVRDRDEGPIELVKRPPRFAVDALPWQVADYDTPETTS